MQRLRDGGRLDATRVAVSEELRGPPAGSLAFALESTISLLRAPEARLTTSGEYVQIALRLLGPLFLGLALLALRGRVKQLTGHHANMPVSGAPRRGARIAPQRACVASEPLSVAACRRCRC
jgi:hypothetical protein